MGPVDDQDDLKAQWTRVGDAVKDRRLALGWTQQDAADRAGVSLATWRLIELAGRERFQELTLRGLVRGLGWPVGLDRAPAGRRSGAGTRRDHRPAAEPPRPRCGHPHPAPCLRLPPARAEPAGWLRPEIPRPDPRGAGHGPGLHGRPLRPPRRLTVPPGNWARKPVRTRAQMPSFGVGAGCRTPSLGWAG